jgi:hypothetical protein
MFFPLQKNNGSSVATHLCEPELECTRVLTRVSILEYSVELHCQLTFLGQTYKVNTLVTSMHTGRYLKPVNPRAKACRSAFTAANGQEKGSKSGEVCFDSIITRARSGT